MMVQDELDDLIRESLGDIRTEPSSYEWKKINRRILLKELGLSSFISLFHIFDIDAFISTKRDKAPSFPKDPSIPIFNKNEFQKIVESQQQVLKEFLLTRKQHAEFLLEKQKIFEPKKIVQVKKSIQIINSNIFERVYQKPEKYLFPLRSREFEEFYADLLSILGFEVEITKQTRDEGIDILAYKKDLDLMVLAVECKKYSPHIKVGRPVIQKLHSIVEHKGYTGGIVATTSFFTRDARNYITPIKYRIFLHDYDTLLSMIEKAKEIKSYRIFGR